MSTGPLHDIRVLDFTHVWSGPMGTRALAALGAEVIKVEGPERPDMLRGVRAVGVTSRFPDFFPGENARDRNAWFNTQNTDKYGITLDIKDPRGLELVREIAATSQVFIANYRPGVLSRIGLGEDALREVRPDLIYAEMPGYGEDGPMAGMQAYGAQFEANSGAAAITGGDGPPLLTGYALGDAVAGAVGDRGDLRGRRQLAADRAGLPPGDRAARRHAAAVRRVLPGREPGPGRAAAP